MDIPHLQVSLLTDNGNTKDDLRLPTDESLLSQVGISALLLHQHQDQDNTFLFSSVSSVSFDFGVKVPLRIDVTLRSESGAKCE